MNAHLIVTLLGCGLLALSLVALPLVFFLVLFFDDWVSSCGFLLAAGFLPSTFSSSLLALAFCEAGCFFLGDFLALVFVGCFVFSSFLSSASSTPVYSDSLSCSSVSAVGDSGGGGCGIGDSRGGGSASTICDSRVGVSSSSSPPLPFDSGSVCSQG